VSRAHRQFGTLCCLAVATAGLAAIALSAAPAKEAGAPQSPIERGWRLEMQSQFREAHETFAAAADSRDVRFARAMTLLNVQPKTRGNIDEAASALQALAAEDSRDDIGVAAKYFLGRIEEAHRYEPDVQRALEIYTELIREHPEHYYGQMALVKWGVLRLYDPAGDAGRRAVLDELRAVGKRLTHRDAQRAFHMMLADAICRFELSDALALEHLLAAARLGAATRMAEADLYVRVGELARIEGKTDLAAEYYRRMLERFPRDTRAYMIRQRLRDLGAETTPGKGAAE